MAFYLTTTEPQNEVKGGVLLNRIILEGVSVLELLASEDQALLIWWDAFLVLDLGLDVFNPVGWLDFEGDVLASEGLDENLHTTTEPENEVEGGVLLNGVVLKGVAVFELLASEDQSLLIWWDTFLILDLSLDVLDSICWLDLKRNVLPCQSLNENLHQKGQV